MRNQIIDSRQIAAFAALVRHRSFTRAAEALFLTQSAVSHAIKSLEQDIGCRLVERNGRHVTLTKAGEQLRQHTERILGEMRAAREEIKTLSSEARSQLSVGAGALACQYLMPRVMKEFKESHPACSITLESGNRDGLLDLLRTQRIDFALTIEGPASEGIAFEQVFEDELLFFVSAQHAWKQLGRVPRTHLAKETIVVPDKTNQTFKIVEEYFRAERITFKNLLAPGSLDAAKQLVIAGLGVGVFAPWQVSEESAAGKLIQVPLVSKRLARTWIVAHLNARRLVPIEQEFIKRCKSALEMLCVAVLLAMLEPGLVTSGLAGLGQLLDVDPGPLA